MVVSWVYVYKYRGFRFCRVFLFYGFLWVFDHQRQGMAMSATSRRLQGKPISDIEPLVDPQPQLSLLSKFILPSPRQLP